MRSKCRFSRRETTAYTKIGLCQPAYAATQKTFTYSVPINDKIFLNNIKETAATSGLCLLGGEWGRVWTKIPKIRKQEKSRKGFQMKERIKNTRAGGVHENLQVQVCKKKLTKRERLNKLVHWWLAWQCKAPHCSIFSSVSLKYVSFKTRFIHALSLTLLLQLLPGSPILPIPTRYRVPFPPICFCPSRRYFRFLSPYILFSILNSFSSLFFLLISKTTFHSLRR